MTLKAEGVEAKLDAIQGKLDAMHAEIRKMIPPNGSSGVLISGARTNGHRLFNSADAQRHVDIGSVGGVASPNVLATHSTSLGRAHRFPASVELSVESSSAHGPNMTNEHTPSFLPAISRSPVQADHVDVSIVGANSLSVRRKADAAKQKREEFTCPMRLNANAPKVKELRGAPCAWLLSIALACSYVSGEKMTIEDILLCNRLGVHYISFPSVTLAELFDITNEFLFSHTKLENKNIHCEMATFDTETVDDAGDVIGMGERSPIMTLSQFRKELTMNNSDAQSIYIVNYDPYVIEQYEIGMRMNSSEAFDIDMNANTPRWSPNNQGTFALIFNFNSALHTVSIGTPHLLENGCVDIREHTVPMQTLYKALCVKDNYCNRPRGFVRVFISADFVPSVPSIFPLKVLDGSSKGGFITTAFDTSISPHILGLALLHHLVTSILLSRSVHQRQINNSMCDATLRGIPVTKICQVLRLDIATIVRGSNKSSVPVAFSWYRIFIRRIGIENAVAFGLVLPARRGGTEDGPLNVSDETFMSHIELAMESKSVLLMGFDVNVALNVIVDKRPEPCHFAIVIGLDKERGIVRLADVNVKKYRKTWHVPIVRLYAAVIGYGYMMAATSQATVDKLNAREFEQMVISGARYNLPPMKQRLRFEYPAKNYVVTVLADAFTRLGFSAANVESVANKSGYHLSFMLSEHLPLENAATVARNYSHNRHGDAVSVTVVHMDKDAGYTSLTLLKQIRTALESPKTQCLIINFATSIIQAKKEVWNGGNGGSYAIVVDYDENSSLVTLSDANHVAFYRTWVCPLEALYDAVSAMDPIALRARGTLLLTLTSQEGLYVDCYGYDMSRSLVHHPFKPSFSPTFHCFGLVASQLSSGPRACSASNSPAQFSAEDFLYAMPSFSVHNFLMGAFKSEDITALANTAFRVLQIPLEAVVVEVGTAKNFLEVCQDQMSCGRPVTMTLVGYNTKPIHGVGGSSVGIINRVRKDSDGGTLQIVDGNGCTFGSVWERPVAELHRAVTALVRIRRI